MSATAPAGCSRRFCRRTTTPPTPIICISTRLRGAKSAGACAARGSDSPFADMKKGTRRSGSPLRTSLSAGLFQMVRQMLVHLEHAAAVLAEDLAQLVVRHNFSFVLRVLQVVLANVIPNLGNHLAARKRIIARDRCELR